MPEVSQQIASASAKITQVWPRRAQVGLILGTGLGSVADQITIEAIIPYEAIPGFPRATAPGHAGQLVCGRLGGASVVAMQGRFHIYEGYTPTQATLPVRVINALGADLLLISNASGGLNPHYVSGDVMIIDDHINFLRRNPAIGRREASRDAQAHIRRPYDPALIDLALDVARRGDFICHRGVYAAMTGPNFETPAEYRFLRRLGADAVGMSTVPEVIVAVQSGMRVLGLSAVTNLCRPDRRQATDGDEVQAWAEIAAPKIHRLVTSVLARYLA